MTYKDIEKVNKEMKTTDIKGKQYAEVPQRIQAFRKLYPEGFIRTNIVSLDNGVVVIKAEVGYNEGQGDVILGTGLAYEKEGSTFINKTSYIENCETSAVGRALGMLGIGSETSVASAEEVQNAMVQQKAEEDAKKPISAVMVKAVRNLIEKNGFDETKTCAYYKIAKIEDMTVAQLSDFNARVEKAMKEQKNEGQDK